MKVLNSLIDPVTRKRLRRFRQIKRGYYSLLILVTLTILSLFANFIANSRALIVHYNGKTYFPIFQFIPSETFGQEDFLGYVGAETDYARLAREFQGTDNWVLRPLFHYNATDIDITDGETTHPRPPKGDHVLGTDQIGRDVFARLFYGFRISMVFSLSLVLLGTLVGTIIGCAQGYFSGWFDIGSQRFIEIWSSLPFLYVVILLSTIFKPSFFTLLITMAAFEWIAITYYMRTETYREKTREYIAAARSMGASHFRIIFRHLLPNSLVPLITITPFAIVGGIFSLSALDYLGYGLQATQPSWGQMIEEALDSASRGKLWLIISPFATITTTLVLVTLIGESIREAFDPRQYSRYR